ncbi:hypothetical protein JCGZ_06556 [Jatropha curcas]|uniref:Uncharacterized protein n=1 Tax=Jatropha curcas TaxID=180498 RepID=A0A067LHF6_JATCU|nr:hypothetical protein JCGZ_06556 [Jatropha curcas]
MIVDLKASNEKPVTKKVVKKERKKYYMLIYWMNNFGQKFIRNASQIQKPGLGSAELLLRHLEATYTKIVDINGN